MNLTIKKAHPQYEKVELTLEVEYVPDVPLNMGSMDNPGHPSEPHEIIIHSCRDGFGKLDPVHFSDEWHEELLIETGEQWYEYHQCMMEDRADAEREERLLEERE